MVSHSMVKCRNIMEKIQELLNNVKSNTKLPATTLKAPTINVMTASHLTSPLKVPDKEKEEEELNKGIKPVEEKLEKEKQP